MRGGQHLGFAFHSWTKTAVFSLVFCQGFLNSPSVMTSSALPLVALYLLPDIAYQKRTNKMDKKYISKEFETIQLIGMETLPSLFLP